MKDCKQEAREHARERMQSSMTDKTSERVIADMPKGMISQKTIEYQTRIAQVATQRSGKAYTQQDVYNILSSWQWMTKSQNDARLAEFKANETEFKAYLAAKAAKQSK